MRNDLRELDSLDALEAHIQSLPDGDTAARWLEGAGFSEVRVDVDCWEVLFESARDFFFAPLVELRPSPLETGLGAWRRDAGRLLLHQGSDRHLIQGPRVRGLRRRRGGHRPSYLTLCPPQLPHR